VSLIHNEQTKLTATALNNIVVAFVIAGFVGPVVALGYGSDALPKGGVAILVSLIWLFVGFILHSIAKLILRDLKP
jgi:sugar phosphate permease